MLYNNQPVEDIGTAIEIIKSLRKRIPMRGEIKSAVDFIEQYVAETESKQETKRVVRKNRKSED